MHTGIRFRIVSSGARDCVVAHVPTGESKSATTQCEAALTSSSVPAGCKYPAAGNAPLPGSSSGDVIATYNRNGYLKPSSTLRASLFLLLLTLPVAVGFQQHIQQTVAETLFRVSTVSEIQGVT